MLFSDFNVNSILTSTHAQLKLFLHESPQVTYFLVLAQVEVVAELSPSTELSQVVVQ